MRTLSQDEIVLLVSSNFSSEWIEESKRLLFEFCTTTVRCIRHKGPQKDTNNIKDCLKVLNECGENIPRFVSHYLDELPPVGFGSMDASALLSRMERLSRDVLSLKEAMEIQASVNKNLAASTAAMNRRLAAVESPCSSSERAGEAAAPAHGPAAALAPELSGKSEDALSQYQTWSTVVRRAARKQKRPTDKVTQNGRGVDARPNKEQRRNVGIIGTGPRKTKLPA
ncbi:PREDICTED: uncharacterized protein LOC106908000 [Poecilia mexicana]|uniref:uncharacterized protein LOC106908000 n=1 Tax=Poecilia mexicana TaxID=48701 RepID=UPI00072E978F|nr:PREDICTED: uncharacterized protein LOC106908000 [Poecilia mexicana]XP_014829414.1 PREDICTED: uncharacterized protein LOC106908000 [Poecilia mexicana]